jgi:hypothetical protein
VVVIFQGGANDREALRISRRFVKHAEDVFLEVFALERSEMMTLRVSQNYYNMWLYIHTGSVSDCLVPSAYSSIFFIINTNMFRIKLN